MGNVTNTFRFNFDMEDATLEPQCRETWRCSWNGLDIFKSFVMLQLTVSTNWSSKLRGTPWNTTRLFFAIWCAADVSKIPEILRHRKVAYFCCWVDFGDQAFL